MTEKNESQEPRLLKDVSHAAVAALRVGNRELTAVSEFSSGKSVVVLTGSAGGITAKEFRTDKEAHAYACEQEAQKPNVWPETRGRILVV